MSTQEREDDFDLGVSDCSAGLPHKKDQSKEYDDGYSFQYQQEQVSTYLSEQKV